jgi:amidase
MNHEEYAALDGVGLAQAISSGDVSREEVLETAIEAIEKLNPKLNAVVMKNYEVARSTTSSGDDDSPLSGAPFLLKDVNVYTKDMPTTFSCRFFKDNLPRYDSEIVKRWRQAGLVVLGKTNTPEFAEDFVCEPALRGPTLNPWDVDMTTGGSSGGAAAAVASGMVPIAHATDLGGSIRIPAASCGVYGLKPTTGLCPIDASNLELASGFNSDHVVTRSVRDSAATLDATAKPILGRRYETPRSIPSYLDCLDQPLQPLKVGVCLNTPTGLDVPKHHQQAVISVSSAIADMGHEVVEYRYPQELVLDEWMDLLWMFDVIADIENQIKLMGREPERDELEPLTWYMRDLMKKMTAMDHHQARVSAHNASVVVMNSMSDLDIVLTPALGSDPVPVGYMEGRSYDFSYDRWAEQGFAFAPFAYVCNITGQPAASLPIKLDESRPPCGVQIAAHSGQDHVILQLSSALEEKYKWHDYVPPIHLTSV